MRNGFLDRFFIPEVEFPLAYWRLLVVAWPVKPVAGRQEQRRPRRASRVDGALVLLGTEMTLLPEVGSIITGPSRLACCFATEAGIRVCAPVHDAVLIEAPLDCLDQEVARMQACMAHASKIVLGGLELRSDALLIRYPDRYMDPRGERMWQEVMGILGQHGGLVA